MKIYCTLYRKTPKGLKVIGTAMEYATMTPTGIVVRPSYSGLKAGYHDVVHGLSFAPGTPKRLRELEQVHIGWCQDAFTVTHRLDFEL